MESIKHTVIQTIIKNIQNNLKIIRVTLKILGNKSKL